MGKKTGKPKINNSTGDKAIVDTGSGNKDTIHDVNKGGTGYDAWGGMALAGGGALLGTAIGAVGGRALGRTAPKPHVTEQFPRLNKKQHELLDSVEYRGVDRVRSLHEGARTGDVGGVLEDYDTFTKLKYEDVAAVANRSKLQAQSNLERAGYGPNIKVWRTDFKGFETDPRLNNPNLVVSTTVEPGGVSAYRNNPKGVTNAYTVRRSDVLGEFVTNPNDPYNWYPHEKELLVFRKDLKPLRWWQG